MQKENNIIESHKKPNGILLWDKLGFKTKNMIRHRQPHN